MKIAIIGAGCQGLVVSDIIDEMKKSDKSICVIGFIDDGEMNIGKKVGNYKIIGRIKDLSKLKADRVIVAIGDNKTRNEIVRKIKTRYFTAIHPSAVISKSAQVLEGSMVLGGVVVNAGARIGKHVILNTGCTVDHHNVINDFVHVAPGVHLGGNVKIGNGVLVGIGATVINNITIGKWTVIGAGSVVVKNIKGNIVTFGTPAKYIRDNR